MDELELQAEFNRLTEDSERRAPELWSEDVDLRDTSRRVFELDDFMWCVYKEYGLVKLWELYNTAYRDESRPGLRKLISQFVELRSRGRVQ